MPDVKSSQDTPIPDAPSPDRTPDGRVTEALEELRVGRRVPEHVYEGDRPLFTAPSADLAAEIVEAVNERRRFMRELDPEDAAGQLRRALAAAKEAKVAALAAERRTAERAGAETMREACACRVENGRFLHADAPPARFAKEVAAAIRALPLPEGPAERTGWNWRPIDTGPRDGRAILLWKPHRYPITGRWDDERQRWVTGGSGLPLSEQAPTHWCEIVKPLPEGSAGRDRDGRET